MACIDPSGVLSPTAKAVLQTLQAPMSAQDLAEKMKVPLFKVRASLREMMEAGLVKNEGEAYVITDQGREKLG
ncbi:helix-turn-helix transcriptional regulator [Candidatus Sumerlaeota bacterium]|nr:helix-turn-helix transcriptional regulator [Candidatus Sumerlaeota bacterium]